ncbi:MAG: hypothetical protein ACLP5H_02790 [Desulfomonilaceae bacterium]
MVKFVAVASNLLILMTMPLLVQAQQKYRLPDLSSMKHITTKQSNHAPDIPGNQTTMDYYSSPNGDVVTVYSYRGRTVAFSAHSNKDVQGTYRIFMDLTGEGFFQEINRGVQWQLPQWVK